MRKKETLPKTLGMSSILFIYVKIKKGSEVLVNILGKICSTDDSGDAARKQLQLFKLPNET